MGVARVCLVQLVLVTPYWETCTDSSAPLDPQLALSPAGRHSSSLYWMPSQTSSASKKSGRISCQIW